MKNEYNFIGIPESAKVIVDVGANIGLASIYFGDKYKSARIISVEPESENFRLLCMNVGHRAPLVALEHAAVWNKDGSVSLRTHDEAGNSLDSWGVQVIDAGTSQTADVPAFTLDTIFRRHRLDQIDILKIDVEGAELEIFSAASQEWKRLVDCIMIETHERFRPGCEAAVRSALADDFEHIAGAAEMQVFRRRRPASRAAPDRA